MKENNNINFIRYFLLLSFLIFLLPSSIYSQEQRVAFIIRDNGSDAESDSAFSFLIRVSNISAEKLLINDMSASSEKYDLIWYHKGDTTELQQSDEKILILYLKEYYSSGGRVFLTMDAVRYLQKLGLEENAPDIRHVNAADNGYGRKLGLHAFRHHPIFNDLNGGAYMWNGHSDNVARQVGYFDDNIPKGKVAAVDWSYITLKESSKLVLEYFDETGKPHKGRVLAAGAYIYFSLPNYNRLPLEKFIMNCILTVGEKIIQPRSYWNYESISVEEFSFNSEKINAVPSLNWPEGDKTELKSLFASDNYWNVTGERIFISGKEKSGIDELWIHPFMAFRDYEVGIKFSYKDTIYWLKDEVPSIKVRPGSFHREYKLRRAFIKEIVTADVNNPAGIIHYEYRGVYPAKLIIKFKSNLRYMWPYSAEAFRGLKYAWSKSLNSFCIAEKDSQLVSFIGSGTTPEYTLAGWYDDFNLKDSTFEGNPTSKLIVSGIMIFNMAMNSNLDIIAAGSSESYANALNEYKKAASDPYLVNRTAEDYYMNFFDDKLSVSTPDNVFNEGYKWALIGTDKFFVNTPGIGRSLVAGYSTTARGWDGGHEVNGRPGYAWYFGRDAQWSAMAVNGYGDFNKVKDVLLLFNKYQDLDGKIYHELTTSGVVHYDASDATPLYVVLAGHYLKHSGDTKFINETWDNIKRAMDFCRSTDTDGDHLIEITNVGHGWVEGGALYGVQTEVYLAACWAEALKSAAYMASVLEHTAEAKEYMKEYDIVRSIIANDFWNEETGFINFGKFKDGTYNTEKTVLAAVPLYFNLFDKKKGKSAADIFAGHRFTSDWGVRIISEESPLFNPRGYHYGSVWPLFTGWTSLAEYRYGNYLQGFSHIMNNLKVYQSFSKGYVEEVLNGAEYLPSGVCPHQCWSETMVLQPVIEGMLGLDSDVPGNKLNFAPRLPADWNFIELKNIPFGNEELTCIMKRDDETYKYNFTGSGNEIYISFTPSLPPLTKVSSVTINGKDSEFRIVDENSTQLISINFILSENAEVIIHYSGGISILPFISDPVEGDSSTGIRITGADIINMSSSEDRSAKYEIRLEGKPGTESSFLVYSHDPFDIITGEKVTEGENNIYKINVSFEKLPNRYIEKTIRLRLKEKM